MDEQTLLDKAAKLRAKADKLIAAARQKERKRKEAEQRKIMSAIEAHIKIKGFQDGDDLLLKIKSILEPEI